jgi:hypothetical protein
MTKKEIVKITPEGLNLLMAMNYDSIEGLGFYGKELFFSDGFSGDKQYLFQAFGNIGAFVRDYDLDKDASYIILSNGIIKHYNDKGSHPFISDTEERINQSNSPYRKIKLLSEEHIVCYLENRSKVKNDKQLEDLIKKYKSSKNKKEEHSLF